METNSVSFLIKLQNASSVVKFNSFVTFFRIKQSQLTLGDRK